MGRRLPPLLLLGVAVLPGALAHRPLLPKASCGSDFSSSATALDVPDPTISWSFKHYLDCNSRAVWMTWQNPQAGQLFYIGVGIPPQARFADLRADAVLIGPGLPALSSADRALIPPEVLADPVWDIAGVGAILRRSPADQSTCAHLGEVMQRSSSVVNGRCNFYEPFGRTNSWRVLDADGNFLPTAGGTYYAVVFLQSHSSGKVGIALGTWVENFWTPHPQSTPACTREIIDFSEEKDGDQSDCFPVQSCPATIDCTSETGPTCATVASGTPPADSDMVCGGLGCPMARYLWSVEAEKMHKEMAISFTCDPKLDFVHGMIPHHIGAVRMCEVLLQNLTCPDLQAEEVAAAEHLCAHVMIEQEREVGGMREWLANHSKPDAVLCDQTGSEMVMGCGDMSCQSSKDFMAANHEMHMAMMVDITCEHSVDFMRGMIPHHAGAILMCQVLANATAGDPDPFLEELCANITAVQYSEMAWMSEWLRSNGKPVVATCQDCGAMQPTQPPPLCEDTLPTSSFCHTLGGDLNCKCSTAIASHPCGEVASISGFGLFNTTAECMRTCGHCPTERPPLFHHPCGGHDHGGHDGHDGHDGPDDHEGHSHVTVDAAQCAEARFALALASMAAAALS